MKTFLSIFLSLAFSVGAFAQVPVLNSYPSAQATLFLDFDGQYIAGTPWNWSGPIDAQPATLSTAQITEICKRVSEDFGIFNLNVTTDSTIYLAAPPKARVRIIVTPTSSWYGSAGGVSFVGSFSWGNNTPAWVFSALLGNSVKKISEAISHEAGHALGLQHQSIFDGSCNKTAEYAPGQGAGEIGWAPIMGVGYSKNLTTWHNGTSAMGCSYIQNDIDVITAGVNNFGLRNDDHLDILNGASPIVIGYASSASGIINTAADRDVFRFDLAQTNNFRLSAIPQNVGAGNAGANVDIKVALLDQSADTIGRYNPADLLNVGIDTNLNSGTYYLVVDGVENANLSDYGSVGFYTLSASILTVLPVHRLALTAKTSNDDHNLHWNYFADEAVKEIHVESSRDGIHFNFLSKLTADTRSFSWKPATDEGVHYRIKVIVSSDERAYYSNIVELKRPSSTKSIQVGNHLISDYVTVNVDKTYAYQLFDATGRLLQTGNLRKGSNQLSTAALRNGVFYLRIQYNSETYTEKLIKR